MSDTTAATKPAASPRTGAAMRVLSIPEVGILLPLIGFTVLFTALDRALLSGENISSMLGSSQETEIKVG